MSDMKHAALRRSRGAIALMFAFSLFVLFGVLALAIDLGRTYVVRTELQNAADAAALAGAQELDQTLDGINRASNRAIAMAAQNNFRFSSQVVITAANLAVGGCPEDACMMPISAVTTNALARGQTFLRVQVSSGNIGTFFASLMPTASGSEITNTQTFGRAVAGRFVNDVTPLGVCSLKDSSGAAYQENDKIPGTNELVNFGFRRGMSYNIFDLGNIGGPSTPYLINPVDVYPNPCHASNASANATAPFVCTGSSAVVTTVPGTVYGNTGVSSGRIQAALNSRFNDYSGPSVCDPVQSPPDTNIRPFGCTGTGCETPAADWMAPTRQSIDPAVMPLPPDYTTPTPATASDYGVLWSYSRAVTAVGTAPDLRPGAAFSPTQWSTLYSSAGGAPTNTSFPTATSPYLDPTRVIPPTGNIGRPNRRVLNLAIVDCGAATGSGSCKVLPVLGIGRFFLQTPASGLSGGPNAKVNVEFAGLVEQLPNVRVTLYR